MGKSLVFAALTFLAAVPLVAALLFFPVMILAGPHSSLVPSPLQPVVLVCGWLATAAVPAWLAVKVFRRINGRR